MCVLLLAELFSSSFHVCRFAIIRGAALMEMLQHLYSAFVIFRRNFSRLFILKANEERIYDAVVLREHSFTCFHTAARRVCVNCVVCTVSKKTTFSHSRSPFDA